MASAAPLAAADDAYGGVLVDAEALPADAGEFQDALERSLQAWSQAGKRGIWLKLPLSRAALVSPAAAAGFTFHHAEELYVMMARWLPATPNTLPPNASHQVGVGAFVLDEQGRVLVVQEKNGPLKGKAVWKMPTGLVHAGEDLHEAAEREVLEETGVRARFHGVLAIRQGHNFAFGKSDLFFCCALRAEPGQEHTKPCDTEIEAAAWLPLEEYQRHQQEFHRGLALYATLMERCLSYARGDHAGLLAAERLDSGLWKPRQDLLMWGGGGAAAAAAREQGGAPVGASSL